MFTTRQKILAGRLKWGISWFNSWSVDACNCTKAKEEEEEEEKRKTTQKALKSSYASTTRKEKQSQPQKWQQNQNTKTKKRRTIYIYILVPCDLEGSRKLCPHYEEHPPMALHIASTALYTDHHPSNLPQNKTKWEEKKQEHKLNAPAWSLRKLTTLLHPNFPNPHRGKGSFTHPSNFIIKKQKHEQLLNKHKHFPFMPQLSQWPNKVIIQHEIPTTTNSLIDLFPVEKFHYSQGPQDYTPDEPFNTKTKIGRASCRERV